MRANCINHKVVTTAQMFVFERRFLCCSNRVCWKEGHFSIFRQDCSRTRPSLQSGRTSHDMSLNEFLHPHCLGSCTGRKEINVPFIWKILLIGYKVCVDIHFVQKSKGLCSRNENVHTNGDKLRRDMISPYCQICNYHKDLPRVNHSRSSWPKDRWSSGVGKPLKTIPLDWVS